MTELMIYNVLSAYLGRRPVDKEEARIALREMIKAIPAWKYCLPESLLDKLDIKYDHRFDDKEKSLAAAIGGKLERRFI